MNAPALPAYLQNRQSRTLVDDATAGMGSSLPAHISTEGGVFTLVDAAGNAQRLTFKADNGQVYQQPFLDACVVDVNAGLSKRYYGGKKYAPGSGDAPVCWSANGVEPSRDSSQKQSPTCASCKWNERGSATSEKSGASIKACRDEKWLALSVPQTGLATIFRYVLTPGSFKKWKAYTEAFKNGAVDLSDVVTRFEFDPDEPNTIKFSATAYIDENTAKLREHALLAKATDSIVGRDDTPRGLPAPAPQAALPPAQPAQEARPFQASAAPAPSAGFQPTTMAPPQQSAQPALAASPSSPAPGRGRRARTAPPAPETRYPETVQQALPLQAPFPTGPAPGQGTNATFAAAVAPGATGGGPVAGATPSFGIQAGVAPNPELAATLASIFPGQR